MTDWSQSEIDQVRHGISDTVERLEELNAKLDGRLQNDRALMEIFNRISGQLEILTQEIRALREDIHPPMDKPGRKLAPLAEPK